MGFANELARFLAPKKPEVETVQEILAPEKVVGLLERSAEGYRLYDEAQPYLKKLYGLEITFLHEIMGSTTKEEWGVKTRHILNSSILRFELQNTPLDQEGTEKKSQQVLFEIVLHSMMLLIRAGDLKRAEDFFEKLQFARKRMTNEQFGEIALRLGDAEKRAGRPIHKNAKRYFSHPLEYPTGPISSKEIQIGESGLYTLTLPRPPKEVAENQIRGAIADAFADRFDVAQKTAESIQDPTERVSALASIAEIMNDHDAPTKQDQSTSPYRSVAQPSNRAQEFLNSVIQSQGDTREASSVIALASACVKLNMIDQANELASRVNQNERYPIYRSLIVAAAGAGLNPSIFFPSAKAAHELWEKHPPFDQAVAFPKAEAGAIMVAQTRTVLEKLPSADWVEAARMAARKNDETALLELKKWIGTDQEVLKELTEEERKAILEIKPKKEEKK